MTLVKVNSKVTPYDIHVPTPKHDNFIEKGKNLIHRLTSLILVQMLLGINRVYLLKLNTLAAYICHSYAFCLFVLTSYVLFAGDSEEKSLVVFKDTAIIEYLILILISSFSHRKTLKAYFRDLATFDDELNISLNCRTTIPIYTAAFWVTSSIIYSIIEFIMLYVYLFDYSMEISFAMIYLVSLAHDTEQILYNTMIRMIMLRVRVMKAHVAKAFRNDKVVNSSKETYEVEALSNNVQLDTTGMHRAYELLHKCAEELNSVMSFPMIVMIFSSGLSTTLLLKKLFQLTQESDQESMKFKATMVYMSFRCIKYTVLVVIPCYYASITTGQVTLIRTMLHNAVNTFKLEKIERRKIKAFFQLTQDNEFAYALWGVIRLSMSLPLSYASLCTTYLVITIQFSKFID